MALAMAGDPLFESLQLLPSKIDSFRKSLSQICKSNNAGAALCKELEDHYHDLHRNVQYMYEELARREKTLEANTRESLNAAQNVSENTEISHAKVPAFAEVEVRKEIGSLCGNMDGEGLRNYIVGNRKEIDALRTELPSALYKAPDSAKLVLKALEGYDFSESASSRAGKRESVASVNRRACILLLECLLPVLGTAACNVSSDAKNKARELAKLWRTRMGIERDASSCNSLDAQAFLQLLATFGIASEYGDDELCSLVLAISRRKQTPTLCKSLGLAAIIPEIVDKLCKSGKQIEALAFAQAIDMMDKVEPVSLLKAYLKDTQEAALAFLKRGHGSLASQNDATMKEVSGLKAVIKAVDDYNLGNLYPTDVLQKRIAQLERSKADRKKSTAANRGPHKRPRTSDDTAGFAETEAPLTVDHMGLPNAKYDSAARSGGAAAVGQAPYNFVGNQNKNEARSPERYALAYRGANTGLVGSSAYGPGAGAGAGAFATPSSNAVKSNYERGGTESFTPAFGGSNKSPGGSAAANFATVFSNKPPGNYDRRGYERYASTFEGANVSPVGSSVYGSGPAAAVLTTPYSNVAQHNYEQRGAQHNYERRGPEPYPSTLSGDRGPVGLSAYGSDMFPFPSNAVESNYQSRGTERNMPAFDSVDRRSMSSSVYASGAAHTTPSSTFHSYQFDGVDRRSMSSSVYGSGAPAAVHTTPSSTVHGYQFDGVDRRSVSSSVYGSGASASASASASAPASARTTSSSTFHGYQFDGGLPSSSTAYRASFLHLKGEQ